MLGRVRSSTAGSLELLEMERKPPKINKHDSLSIYESTLLKLKEGSRSSRNLPSTDSSEIDSSRIESTDSPDEAMTGYISTVDSYTDGCSGLRPSKGQRRTSLSIIDMFAKYKSSRNVDRADERVSMDVEGASSSVFRVLNK